MDPTYPLYPLLAILAAVLCLVPLPWHLQAWNSGTCAFMIWTALTALSQGINCIIWRGNVLDVAPVWCDISSQIMLGAGIGTPASILCISRRLYKITSTQNVSVTRKDKRRDIIIDLCIALGIPLMVLALHTTVHAHRYDILEDIGCYPVTYSTILSFFVLYMWPILLGCVSFVYSGLTLRSFFRRRAQFASLVSRTGALNMNRYLRLMALSLADMAFTVPFSIYLMVVGTRTPLNTYISWEETHYDWNRHNAIPALIWRMDPDYRNTVELTRWLAVFCGLVFFGLFGFSEEAMKSYKKVFWGVAGRLGYKPDTKPAHKARFSLPSWRKAPSKTDSQATLPVYSISSPPPKRRIDSLGDVSFELSACSPTTAKGTDTFEISPSSPPMYTSPSRASFDTSRSHCPSSLIAETSSTVVCVTDADMDFIDISSRRTSSPLPVVPTFTFEDDFKPLPPLPKFERAEPRGFTPVRSPSAAAPLQPPGLRHAASVPLPNTYQLSADPSPSPVEGQDEQGSVSVSIVTQVDER